MAEAPFGYARYRVGYGYVTPPTSRVTDDESDIEALMPKLRHPYYYTRPTIEELAARERAQPGYCRRGIWGFVVGRHGVGRITFLGRVDVRRLDLESFFTFDDDGRFSCRFEKQPLLGYNWTAQIKLLVENFSESFKKNMEDQGLKFVSYDPIKGEAEFWVSYLSEYGVIRFNKSKKSIRRTLNFWLFLRI